MINMLLFHSPESNVLPVVRYHTGVAFFVFWCCLVRDLLISVCWFACPLLLKFPRPLYSLGLLNLLFPL